MTPIYLDYHATTPADPRVVEAMLPWFTARFGNPHSTHAFGREAAAAVESARASVAALLGADPREIVFTSGATEANNLAIKGAFTFLAEETEEKRNGIVTLVTEHKCVLESCARLKKAGARVSVLPVRADGLVDLDLLAQAITSETALVSVMAVNNEIGVVQPLAAIGALCRERGVLFHTDAAQAAGRIALDVEAMAIDLLSISAHKMYGPKGVGALYVRRRPRVRLLPLIDGGGQERGLRSGTLPVPLCVGLGEAAGIAMREREAETARLLALRRRLFERLAEALPGIRLNGSEAARVAGNLNLAVPGLPAEALMAACPSLAFSTGSACTAAEVEPSYVLRALGIGDDLARSSIRLGLGRFTTEDEAERAAAEIIRAVLQIAR